MDSNNTVEQTNFPNGNPHTGVGKIYVKPYHNGSLRAFVDVNYAGLSLISMRLIESESGVLFLGPPSELDKETNKWRNHYTIYDRELKARLTEAVVAEYKRINPHGNQPPQGEATQPTLELATA
jgi:DNA-binding cell septation regulator SpoVG